MTIKIPSEHGPYFLQQLVSFRLPVQNPVSERKSKIDQKIFRRPVIPSGCRNVTTVLVIPHRSSNTFFRARHAVLPILPL